jgi:TRAP-type uncharacterized transport system fused permease subunit
MGGMLLNLGAWNILAMIFMAYVFGWLVGAGLPPTATYIIGAVVIVQPLVSLGINPWVAHFFVFLLSVWGELSPPTSLTAAISSRIAEASFMRTMWEALKLCLPITLMTFAIFTRSEMVVTPGWTQVLNTAAMLIGASGLAFAMFGSYTRNFAAPVVDRRFGCRAVPPQRHFRIECQPAGSDRPGYRHPPASRNFATGRAGKAGEWRE